jgi:hypothetical protein
VDRSLGGGALVSAHSDTGECRAECVEPWDAAGDFGTALGPLLLSGLLKAGETFHVIVPACAILGVVVVGVSLQARSSLRRANGKA